jgi:hypothetical protein
MKSGYDLPTPSRWTEMLSERIHRIKDVRLEREFLAVNLSFGARGK